MSLLQRAHDISELQQRVDIFRSQKEVMKARYTAAQASASVDEEAAGISRNWLR